MIDSTGSPYLTLASLHSGSPAGRLPWTARASGVNTWLRGIVYKPYFPLPNSPPAPSAKCFYYSSGSNGSGLFYAAGQNGALLSFSDGVGWRVAENYYPPEPMLAKDIEVLAEG